MSGKPDVYEVKEHQSTAEVIAAQGIEGLDRHMHLHRIDTVGPIERSLVEDLMASDPDLRKDMERKRAARIAARDAAREEYERKLRDGG